jgi:hypothetical protein
MGRTAPAKPAAWSRSARPLEAPTPPSGRGGRLPFGTLGLVARLFIDGQINRRKTWPPCLEVTNSEKLTI